MNTVKESAVNCVEKSNPAAQLTSGRCDGIFNRLHGIEPAVFVSSNTEIDYANRTRGVLSGHHLATTLDELLNPEDYLYDSSEVGGLTPISAPDDLAVVARTGDLGLSAEEVEELAMAMFTIDDSAGMSFESFLDGFRAYFALAKQTSEKQV